MKCPLQRKHAYEASSLRRAIVAMLEDRFTPDEIAIGLEVELSEVMPYVRMRQQEQRIADRLEYA